MWCIPEITLIVQAVTSEIIYLLPANGLSHFFGFVFWFGLFFVPVCVFFPCWLFSPTILFFLKYFFFFKVWIRYLKVPVDITQLMLFYSAKIHSIIKHSELRSIRINRFTDTNLGMGWFLLELHNLATDFSRVQNECLIVLTQSQCKEIPNKWWFWDETCILTLIIFKR